MPAKWSFDHGGSAVRLTDAKLSAADVVSAGAKVAEAESAHRRLEQTRVDMMRQYAESAGCRRQLLLGYFGEQLEQPCGNCDNCLAGRVRTEAPQGESAEQP